MGLNGHHSLRPPVGSPSTSRADLSRLEFCNRNDANFPPPNSLIWLCCCVYFPKYNETKEEADFAGGGRRGRWRHSNEIIMLWVGAGHGWAIKLGVEKGGNGGWLLRAWNLAWISNVTDDIMLDNTWGRKRPGPGLISEDRFVKSGII